MPAKNGNSSPTSSVTSKFEHMLDQNENPDFERFRNFEVQNDLELYNGTLKKPFVF